MLLNKQTLLLAALASREESSFTLAAILVTPKECVVTDGHQLTRISLPQDISPDAFPAIAGTGAPSNGDTEPFLLSTRHALEILKALPTKSSIPALERALVTIGEDGKPQIVTRDLTSYRVWKPRETGQFPDWQRVLPNPDEAQFKMTFNAELLDRVLKQAIQFQKLGGERSAFCELTFYGPDKPMQVDVISGDQQFQSVVMPCCSNARVRQIEEKQADDEQAEVEPVEPGVTPIDTGRSGPPFRIAGTEVYDSRGQRIAHIASPERIGVLKSYSGDPVALRTAIRQEIERRPPADFRPATTSSAPTGPEADTVLHTPAEWSDMSPQQKAWWTRRNGKPAASSSKPLSLKQQIADLTALLKEKQLLPPQQEAV